MRGRIARAALGLALATRVASAQPAEPAPTAPSLAAEHVRRSHTLTFSTELSPLPTVSAQIDIGAALRVIRRGFAGRVTAGGAYAFSVVGGGDLYGGRAGVAAGYAFALGSRLVLTPLATYDLSVYGQSGAAEAFVIHRLAVELPLTLVVDRRVVVEAFVAAGVAYIDGTRDLAFALGPRIGLVL